jgi:hypothetical protein
MRSVGGTESHGLNVLMKRRMTHLRDAVESIKGHYAGTITLRTSIVPKTPEWAVPLAIRPTVDPDLLGIIADTADIQMPLSDWRSIARLGLTNEQVVRLYGQPPKAVRHLFCIPAKVQRTADRVRQPAPHVAPRPKNR